MREVIRRRQLVVSRADVFKQHQVVILRQIRQGHDDAAARLSLEFEPAGLIQFRQALAYTGLLNARTVRQTERHRLRPRLVGRVLDDQQELALSAIA